MLLRTFLEILQDWQAAFPRQRSYRRAVAQALGTLTAFGRRTLSRALWALGHAPARFINSEPYLLLFFAHHTRRPARHLPNPPTFSRVLQVGHSL